MASFGSLRRDHPLFFWGMTVVSLLLILGIALAAMRIPAYQAEAAEINRKMTAAERATRDQVLESKARRSSLAVGLMQRELRIKALEQKGVHLAINLEDSTLSLRHGKATLRQVPVAVGPDSTIRGQNGRTWRLVRALGERHLVEKRQSPTYTIPEWVYVSRGEAVPAEDERRVAGGLGRYVLRLDDGTEIYTEPSAGPFRDGVKPASFKVRARDLAAIFDAIRKDAPVYIY